MKGKGFLITTLLATTVLIFACGPSQEELDAQSTQVAAEVFATLRADGFVEDDPPTAPFESFRERVLSTYDHGQNRTFIHPDEARLAYFVSMAT